MPADATNATGKHSFDAVLAVAGLLTTSMALYHFWLPFVFRWGDALTEVPALRWGLFMLNASFSFLLLAGGVMTLEIARRGGVRDAASRMVIVTMCGYWLFNGVYQIVAPLPLPRPVAGLRWAFLGFGLSVACLYAAGLVRAPQATQDPGVSGLSGAGAP